MNRRSQLTAAEELPRSPEILQAKNDNTRLLAEIREGQLRAEARERVKNRTLGEIAERYVQTPDYTDAEWLRLVESGRGNSFTELDLREEPDPKKRVEATWKIQKAISERRKARAEATALEAVAARTKLRALQSSATVRHATPTRPFWSGRGVPALSSQHCAQPRGGVMRIGVSGTNTFCVPFALSTKPDALQVASPLWKLPKTAVTSAVNR